jgi:hypothetical protein
MLYGAAKLLCVDAEQPMRGAIPTTVPLVPASCSEYLLTLATLWPPFDRPYSGDLQQPTELVAFGSRILGAMLCICIADELVIWSQLSHARCVLSTLYA